MKEERSCSVCGKMTSKLLFKDKTLNIAMCSTQCEHQFLDTLSRSDEDKVLRHLDHRIGEAKSHNRMCWIIAGLGALVAATGFFITNVNVFLAGVLTTTLVTFLTRYFEDKITKLTEKRKRIAI